MRKIRGYVSSSFEDLTAYRSQARDLLQCYGIEPMGMETYNVSPDVVRKCLDDARDADLLVLIVALRYGTPLEEFEGKSLTELEYDAASDAGRDVLAFLLDEETPVSRKFDDARVGTDRGQRVAAFRQRMVADRRLIGYFADAESFGHLLHGALAERKRIFLDKAERDLGALQATAPTHPVEYALRKYLTDYLESKKGFDDRYVKLAATTMVRELTDEPEESEESEFDHPAIRKALQPRPFPPEQRIEIDDVFQAMALHRQFYLVGEPGGGKTKVLKALEIECAKRHLEDSRAPFPLHLDVTTWDPTERRFAEIVSDELWSTAGVMLPPPSMILLVDGVIDSAVMREGNPLSAIEAWLRKHPRCAAVLAVRDNVGRLGAMPVVRLNALDDARVVAMIEKTVGKSKGEELLQRVGWERRDQAGERDVVQLLRNPFNLSLMCGLHRAGTVPTSRGRLMQQFVSTTHGREHPEAPQGTIGLDLFLDAVGAIAMGMIRMRAKLRADKAWMRKQLPSHVDLDQLIHLAIGCNVMQEVPGREVVEFTHRLLIEYFAAEYLRRHLSLDDVLSRPRYENGERQAQRFDEVIHTLVELEDGADVVAKIASYDPCLAVSCLDAFSTPAAYGDVQAAIADEVVELLDSSDYETVEAALASLAALGENAVGPLVLCLRGGPQWVRRSAVRALSRIYNPTALEAVVDALCDRNSWVREEAEQAIERLDTASLAHVSSILEERIPGWISSDNRRPLERLVRLGPIFAPNVMAQLADFEDVQVEPPVVVAPGWAADPAAADLSEAEDVGDVQEEVASDEAEASAGWGSSWLTQWRSDPGNQEVSTRGYEWLRGTPYKDPSWAHVWTSLWDASPGYGDLLRLGNAWLARVPGKAGSWSHIWIRLHGWYLQHPEPDVDLLRLGSEWLRDARPEHPGWAFVWNELWRMGANREELRRQGRAWMGSVDGAVQNWSLVWKELQEEAPDDSALLAFGERWLERAPYDNPSWGFVWPTLWSVSGGSARLEHLGMDALARVDGEWRAWGYVWPKLWEKNPRDPDLERLGRSWLRTVTSDNRSWYYIWEPLWRSYWNDAELSEAGRRFLATASPLHGEWSRIWTLLWKRPCGDRELVQRGRVWLLQMPKAHYGWGYVWPRLMEACPRDEALLSFGRAYFDEAPFSTRSWPSVWAGMWDHGGDRASLETLGRRWLSEYCQVDGASSLVLQRFLKRFPVDSGLRRDARQWLERWIHHITWPFVWMPMWDAGSDIESVESLDRLGRQWLEDSPKHGEYSRVLERVLDRSPQDVRLHTIGLAWLRDNLSDGRWSSVWITIWKHFSEDELLRQYAREWLPRPSHKDHGWGFVWRKMMAAFPDDPDLLPLGQRFVDDREPREHGWGRVWAYLSGRPSASAALIARGWTWMEQPFFKQNVWSEVWRTLWDRQPEERARLAGVAMAWFIEHSARDDGSIPWDEVVAASIADATARAAACELLVRKPHHPAWPAIARRLLAVPEQRPTVERLIHQWLESNSDHESRGLVQDLLAASE